MELCYSISDPKRKVSVEFDVHPVNRKKIHFPPLLKNPALNK